MTLADRTVYWLGVVQDDPKGAAAQLAELERMQMMLLSQFRAVRRQQTQLTLAMLREQFDLVERKP